MALKTLLQVRTDSPAVTPIDPDECLILDQQTDQPEGEQSTVATLSELIATGGRTVTTAIAYETLYADSVVNVSAASITITVGSAMRNGSRLLIRRTSAYDGNPVTITPPSGATFEGISSLSLYGQYSFVELERVSSTVFVIKERRDEYDYNNAIMCAFGGNTSGFAYSARIARVMINKNNVTIEGRQQWTAKGSGTGGFSLVNLPVPRRSYNQTSGIYGTFLSNGISATGGKLVALGTPTDKTELAMFRQSSLSVGNPIGNTDVGDTATLIFTLNYIADRT